ncbi:MAG TPA: methyltransferase domain-containing protein [Salinimicrobium sp.]|nr:methyltransferase domain-containing protein [Salinimicrobium sp.]
MEKFSFRDRYEGREVMDNFELGGEKLEETLNDLDRVNSWLGGDRVTLGGVKEIIDRTSRKETISIADIGCGNGHMLRELSKWGKRERIKLELTGIDANPNAVSIAKRLSGDYKDISYRVLNIFSPDLREMQFDVILCTLTLHHFKDEQIPEVLRNFLDISRIGVVVNDLQRSKTAYWLFTLFCAAFVSNPIAREDGLISIRRGFKRSDLQKYSADISVAPVEISWRWAFRYRWILRKNEFKISKRI